MKIKKTKKPTLKGQLQNFQMIMKSTLLWAETSQIQMITKVLCFRLSVAILMAFPTYNIVECQNSLDEQTRSLLFMSIEIDRSSTYGKLTWDRLVELLKNHHDYLQVESSDNLNFVLPNSRDTFKDFYTLQIFKINSENSRSVSRYLLKYVDFDGEVWLRVSGYIENDMKLFFDFLREKGVKKKHLMKVVEEWRDSNSIFKEVDFSCLLDGYYNNRTTGDCFIAVAYVNLLDLSIGFDPLGENNINAIFSRVPLLGYFETRK